MTLPKNSELEGVKVLEVKTKICTKCSFEKPITKEYLRNFAIEGI